MSASRILASARRIAQGVRRDERTLGRMCVVPLVVVALLGALYAIGSSNGERLAFKRGELYYNAAVTPAEAQRVGEYLLEQEYFNDQNDVAVQLNKEQEIYRLGFVVHRTDQAYVGDVVASVE